MERQLNTHYLRTLLTIKGWQQAELASAVGVSDAAVSQWLSGEHVPRPGMLVKIAVTLNGDVEKLIAEEQSIPDLQPLIAFRRKGQQLTTVFAEDQALDQGFALERLTPLMDTAIFRPREFKDPSTKYDNLEELAGLIRKELCPDGAMHIDWPKLVSWFSDQGAILVPVFWGDRENHGNALHIVLPASGHTFVYINLDSEELDFKFWLAHEMAHMLTPSLVGTEEGEDFADAFAGSLLFPQRLAAAAYGECVSAKSPNDVLRILEKYATESGVSLNTVFLQCESLAKAKDVPPLIINNSKLHQWRRAHGQRIGKIRRHFFDDAPPADQYIDIAQQRFKTTFFQVLQRYLADTAEGPTYIRRVLHCSMKDAFALHEQFRRAGSERSAD